MTDQPVLSYCEACEATTENPYRDHWAFEPGEGVYLCAECYRSQVEWERENGPIHAE